MLRHLFAAIVVFLSVLPSAGATEPFALPWIDVTINGNPGVLLPREAAHELVYADVDGYWLPGEPWLIEAEHAVIAASADIAEEHRRPQTDGYRQYAGYMRDGQRMIVINSSCVELDGWQSRIVMVMDGGSCFWMATYNATTRELDSLTVNGEA